MEGAAAVMGRMAFRKGEGNSQGDGNIEQRHEKGPDATAAVPWH
jgi:hypothetical protein